MPRIGKGREHRSTVGFCLAVSAIVAVWVGLRQALRVIGENGYTESHMTALRGLELHKGADAGLNMALLFLAGFLSFYLWHGLMRRIVGRKLKARAAGILISAISFALWWLAYRAYLMVEERIPYPFPTTDVPDIAWAGLALGAGLLLRDILPSLAFGVWIGRTVRFVGLVCAILMCAVYVYAHHNRPSPATGRPNVVLIVMDTVRAQNLSLYGYERETTPRLEAYAKECVVYDNAHSVAPWTLPNHAAMFTGLYTSQHGARLGVPQLRGVLTTAAEVLHEEGYETVAYSNNPVLAASAAGYEQGFERWYMPWRRTFANLLHIFNYLPGRPQDEGAYVTGNKVERWLETRDRSRPFFLFINYLEAHGPYWPPKSHRFRFVDDDTENTHDITRYDWAAHVAGKRKTEEELSLGQGLYDGEIAYLDEKIGELLDVLHESGLEDETIVIVTSDHGEEFGEHDLVGHAFGLYRTLTWVPLLVRYPSRLPAGERSNAPVQLVDIFATIIDGTGSPHGIPPEVRSHSLFGESQRTELYAENYHEHERFRKQVWARFPDADLSHYVATLRSLESGGLKVISSSTGEHELYDENTDPGEHDNLAPERPEQTTDMERRIENWFEATRTPLVEMQRDEGPTSEEIRKKLRALGYLH